MNYQTTSLQTVLGWVMRVFRMDTHVFDEVRQDRSATMWAVAVVVVASLFSGFGSWLWWVVRDFGVGGGGDVFLRSFLLGGIFQAAVWTLWVYVVYQVLARGYGVHLDFSGLARAMAFAFAPMMLTVLMLITALAVPIALVALATTLILTNFAIESVSAMTGSRVIWANVAGFTVFALIMGILSNISEVSVVGGIAPGIFFFNLG